MFFFTSDLWTNFDEGQLLSPNYVVDLTPKTTKALFATPKTISTIHNKLKMGTQISFFTLVVEGPVQSHMWHAPKSDPGNNQNRSIKSQEILIC